MKQTALITGASRGIGKEIALLLAEKQHNLILTARSKEALKAVAKEITSLHNVSVAIYPADLADPKAAIQLAETLKQGGQQVDVLVNNAGFGLVGNFAETPIKKELDMMQVNMTALTELTKAFLPGMLARNQGKILNVASTAAFQPGPGMAVYFATKAYVLSLTEALASELSDTPIHVTALCPGPTKTGFEDAASAGKGMKMFSGKIMSAKQVAALGVAGLFNRKTIVVTGLRNKFLLLLNRITPRGVVTSFVKRMT